MNPKVNQNTNYSKTTKEFRDLLEKTLGEKGFNFSVNDGGEVLTPLPSIAVSGEGWKKRQSENPKVKAHSDIG